MIFNFVDSSMILQPSFSRAEVCAWTDLFPNTHPPGKSMNALLNLARSGPSSKIDARIRQT